MLGTPDVSSALLSLPNPVLALTEEESEALLALWSLGTFRVDFEAGFSNGRAFLLAEDGLRGRAPRIIEWTGGRRPPGDQVVPADLRVDHVYLVSCKYLSRILHNLSPSRLVDALLMPGPLEDAQDWYLRLAPERYDALYRAAASRSGLAGLPDVPAEMSSRERKQFAKSIAGEWHADAELHYRLLCAEVSDETARRWAANIQAAGAAERVLWRILRIASAPYFILGSDNHGSMRLRIDTPWDWRQRFELREFVVTPDVAGQPRVGWSATYTTRGDGLAHEVRGHVEVRWSHGRFAQPPEAKVYLDTPHREVPGYNPL
jgi:hypothetical protein